MWFKVIIKTICNSQDPSKKAANALSGSEKCSCLYTMFHMNNNVFSCVLKVVRLQSDIRNAVGKLFHAEVKTSLFTNVYHIVKDTADLLIVSLTSKTSLLCLWQCDKQLSCLKLKPHYTNKHTWHMLITKALHNTETSAAVKVQNQRWGKCTLKFGWAPICGCSWGGHLTM